jgi:hypothetical protein
MSFLTRRPGILVANHLSRHCGWMRPKAPTTPAIGFAGPGGPRVTCLGSAQPQRWRLATMGVDQIATMPTNDSYMTAEIATAITAN